jgi:hypothetical protein
MKLLPEAKRSNISPKFYNKHYFPMDSAKIKILKQESGITPLILDTILNILRNEIDING